MRSRSVETQAPLSTRRARSHDSCALRDGRAYVDCVDEPGSLSTAPVIPSGHALSALFVKETDWTWRSFASLGMTVASVENRLLYSTRGMRAHAGARRGNACVVQREEPVGLNRPERTVIPSEASFPHAHRAGDPVS